MAPTDLLPLLTMLNLARYLPNSPGEEPGQSFWLLIPEEAKKWSKWLNNWGLMDPDLQTQSDTA